MTDEVPALPTLERIVALTALAASRSLTRADYVDVRVLAYMCEDSLSCNSEFELDDLSPEWWAALAALVAALPRSNRLSRAFRAC